MASDPPTIINSSADDDRPAHQTHSTKRKHSSISPPPKHQHHPYRRRQTKRQRISTRKPEFASETDFYFPSAKHPNEESDEEDDEKLSLHTCGMSGTSNPLSGFHDCECNDNGREKRLIVEQKWDRAIEVAFMEREEDAVASDDEESRRRHAFSEMRLQRRIRAAKRDAARRLREREMLEREAVEKEKAELRDAEERYEDSSRETSTPAPSRTFSYLADHLIAHATPIILQPQHLPELPIPKSFSPDRHMNAQEISLDVRVARPGDYYRPQARPSTQEEYEETESSRSATPISPATYAEELRYVGQEVQNDERHVRARVVYTYSSHSPELEQPGCDDFENDDPVTPSGSVYRYSTYVSPAPLLAEGESDYSERAEGYTPPAAHHESHYRLPYSQLEQEDFQNLENSQQEGLNWRSSPEQVVPDLDEDAEYEMKISDVYESDLGDEPMNGEYADLQAYEESMDEEPWNEQDMEEALPNPPWGTGRSQIFTPTPPPPGSESQYLIPSENQHCVNRRSYISRPTQTAANNNIGTYTYSPPALRRRRSADSSLGLDLEQEQDDEEEEESMDKGWMEGDKDVDVDEGVECEGEEGQEEFVDYGSFAHIVDEEDEEGARSCRPGYESIKEEFAELASGSGSGYWWPFHSTRAANSPPCGYVYVKEEEEEEEEEDRNSEAEVEADSNNAGPQPPLFDINSSGQGERTMYPVYEEGHIRAWTPSSPCYFGPGSDEEDEEDGGERGDV